MPAIITFQNVPTPIKRYLTQHLTRILKILHITQGAWHITLLRDPAMKSLHARTLNIPTTTDVLTFDLRDDTRITSEGTPIDLDTALCIDEARRRAAELGHTLREELLLYALHSLLHVQGYDDITPAKSRRMHAREDELLLAAGLRPVYGGMNRSSTAGAMPSGKRPPRAPLGMFVKAHRQTRKSVPAQKGKSR